MTKAELEIFDNMSKLNQLNYLMNAKRAENFAKENAATSLWNGKGDVIRHSFFHALNSVSIGTDLSKRLGDAHEVGSKNSLEKEMDLHNNAVGREFSTKRGYAQTPQDFIETEFLNGNLRYLSPLNSDGSTIPGVSKLTPSNQ